MFPVFCEILEIFHKHKMKNHVTSLKMKFCILLLLQKFIGMYEIDNTFFVTGLLDINGYLILKVHRKKLSPICF